MEPTDLNFEHAVTVAELPLGTWTVACVCGHKEYADDETEANDLAGLHHSETIG